jgi:hypothetical protein
VDNKFPHLYNYLNQIVALSPNFIDVYSLGAENLLIVAGEPDNAISLLKKGIKNNSDSWLLYYKLGQCFHLGYGDRETGIYYYRLASMIPEAPPFLSLITHEMEEGTDDIRIRYKMWEMMYKTTSMKNLRKIAKDKMIQIATRINCPP